jgi:hypothetical protein
VKKEAGQDKICIDIQEITIVSENVLTVQAGTNCPQGGDTGHGGRTFVSFINRGGTDIRVAINGGEFEDVDSIRIVFGGDSEHDTFVEALEFALSVIKKDKKVWIE